jgi:DNA-binding MarR family transcriptional regulator
VMVIELPGDRRVRVDRHVDADAWHNDSCFPGQERLAADMGMSQSRVSEFIKELEGAELIEITRRGQGKTNLYKIKFVVQKAPKGKRRIP